MLNRAQKNDAGHSGTFSESCQTNVRYQVLCSGAGTFIRVDFILGNQICSPESVQFISRFFACVTQ